MNTAEQQMTEQDLIDQAVIAVAEEVGNLTLDKVYDFVGDCLELVEVHEKPMGAEPSREYLKQFRILATYGGPNIWIHAYDYHTEIEGFWGSSKYTVWLPNTEIYDYLIEI